MSQYVSNHHGREFKPWLNNAHVQRADLGAVPTASPYASQLETYLADLGVRTTPLSDSCLVSPSEGYFMADSYPQTPTLSIPDTPVTPGLNLSAPVTPNTPSFGPVSGVYAHTKNDGGLSIPGSPRKAAMIQSTTRFGTRRVGVKIDVVDAAEPEEDAQEVFIPSQSSRILPSFQIQLAAPPAVSSSINKNKGKTKEQEEYAAAGNNSQEKEYSSHGCNSSDADTYRISTSTMTTMDDSIDISMFEMVTPTRDKVFNPQEPALAERPRSLVSPVPPMDTPLRVASPLVRPASDSPASERPTFLRRHRPPPISISQDLSRLVSKIQAAPVLREPLPPVPDDNSILPVASSSGWLPSTRADSPPLVFAESPAPLSPSPEIFKRHRPRSVRSISPIYFGESHGDSETLPHEREHFKEGSGIRVGVHLRENSEAIHGHRHQHSLSHSFKTFDEFQTVSVEKSFLSLDPEHKVESTSNTEVAPSICGGLHQRAKVPELVVSNEAGDVQEETKIAPWTKNENSGGFWKKISASASALFARHDKAHEPVHVPVSKKRSFASLSDYFHRSRSGSVASPVRPAPVYAPEPDVWPPPHRQTSRCSDPTCFFHPQDPRSRPSPMLARPPSSYGSTLEVGDDNGTFLRELGAWSAWEHTNSLRNSTPVGLGLSLNARRDDAVPKTLGSELNSGHGMRMKKSVREEGQKILKGILRAGSTR